MPVYSYECSKCGLELDEVRKMKDHALEKKCSVCEGVLHQVLSLANIAGDFEPYIDENIGPEPVLVKSKRHRRELMAQNGLVEVIQHKYHQPKWIRERKQRREWRQEELRRQGRER